MAVARNGIKAAEFRLLDVYEDGQRVGVIIYYLIVLTASFLNPAA